MNARYTCDVFVFISDIVLTVDDIGDFRVGRFSAVHAWQITLAIPPWVCQVLHTVTQHCSCGLTVLLVCDYRN